METLDEKIDIGLTDTVKDAIGTIAGLHDPDTFIGSREAIYLIINSYLRLDIPPHLDFENSELVFPAGVTRITDKDRLKFYEDNAIVIGKMLKQENKDDDKISDVEKRYGIDIITFALAAVNFSEEVRRAMDARRVAEGKLKATKTRVTQKITSMKRLNKAGLTTEQAHDTTDALLETATPRQVLEIRGSGNSLPIINLNNPAQNPTQKGGK